GRSASSCSVFCVSSCPDVLTVVLLRPRRARRSTLFPYTTLFRSGGRPAHGRRAQPAVPRPGAARRLSGRRDRRPRRGLRSRRPEDRKSTRLNSSHVKISYAVFCLKKKRTTTPTNGTTGRRARPST